MAEIKDERLSLTAMAKNFKEDDISREALLQYMIHELGYVEDIRTVTEKGLSNGVSYKYSETDSNAKWPVYDSTVQKQLAESIDIIKSKYGCAVAESVPHKKKPSKPSVSKQPEKIPMDEYPPTEELFNPYFTSFVAYDFETTGFSPRYDAIIEIGAVKVVNGIVAESKSFTFQEFVKPYKKSVSEEITQVTGITKADVANARPIWEVTKDFVDFIGNDILVGFNNIQFDSKFLARAGHLSGIKIYNKQFDVMKLAARKISSSSRISLSDASSQLGIINPQAHRALADAITTARVYLALR